LGAPGVPTIPRMPTIHPPRDRVRAPIMDPENDRRSGDVQWVMVTQDPADVAAPRVSRFCFRLLHPRASPRFQSAGRGQLGRGCSRKLPGPAASRRDVNPHVRSEPKSQYEALIFRRYHHPAPTAVSLGPSAPRSTVLANCRCPQASRNTSPVSTNHSPSCTPQSTSR